MRIICRNKVGPDIVRKDIGKRSSWIELEVHASRAAGLRLTRFSHSAPHKELVC
jgi:hypothetical protein